MALVRTYIARRVGFGHFSRFELNTFPYQVSEIAAWYWHSFGALGDFAFSGQVCILGIELKEGEVDGNGDRRAVCSVAGIGWSEGGYT